MKRLFTALLLAMTLLPLSVLADKTDIVVLKNGDRITGEIQRLQAGLLKVSTDAMGTIVIEWRYIAQVLSNDYQSVDTTDGRRYLGKLTSLEEGEVIGVQTRDELIELAPDELFTAWPVETSFWDRSDFDISFGLDYQKSTDITDVSMAANWSHRTFDRLTEVSLRSDLTRQNNAPDQRRLQLGSSTQFIRPDRRFNAWLGSAESNESLDLDHRIYFGGVYGKYLFRRSDRWFSLAGGLVANLEKYAQTDSVKSLEAAVTAAYAYYRYADPERSLTTRLTLFPSLTESGRVRSEFRTTFKLELVSDLFWSMELYYQGDNKPPSENAQKTDYGITTSIGWSL